MFKYGIAAIFAVSAPLLADDISESGGFRITAEYLYLKPSVDDTYFVTKGSTSATSNNGFEGRAINNEFDFSSGYRLKGVYAYCDNQFSLGYTHLDANHKKKVAGSYLTATIGVEDVLYVNDLVGYTGTSESKANCLHQRIDALYAQKFFDCGSTKLRSILGVEYVQFRLHESIVYFPEGEDAPSTVKRKTYSWGIGPEVGLAFSYELCRFTNCFPGVLELNLLSTASLLAWETKANILMEYPYASLQSDSGEFNYDISDKKTTKVVTAFHAKVGLDYHFSVCNYAASIGLGYEFDTYINSIARHNNLSYYGAGPLYTGYNDFSLQGFYATGSLQF